MKQVLIIKEDGTKEWYLNNKLHREDGPAVEYYNGTKFWYLNGKLHREDGPAIEYSNGDKAWHFNNKRIKVNSQEDFERYINLIIFK